MAWFVSRQNNSGGYYSDPAQVVYIQAPDAETAQQWIDDNADHSYCDCCGPRWYGIDSVDDLGDDRTIVDEVAALLSNPAWPRESRDDVPIVAVVFDNGTIISGDTPADL